jgi:hypothetical protein
MRRPVMLRPIATADTNVGVASPRQIGTDVRRAIEVLEALEPAAG